MPSHNKPETRVGPGTELWSLADQAVVSGASFIAQLVVARTLTEGEYGVYALSFGALLVANSIHAAFVTYPLLISAAGASPNESRRMASEALSATLLFSIGMGAVLIAILCAFGRPVVGLVTAGCSLAWQLQEVMRRSLMAHMQHQTALWGDLFFYCSYTILLMLLKGLHALTVESALVCLGSMALASLALYFRISRIKFAAVGDGWRLLQLFWPQGRWIAVTNASAAVTGQGFAWALAVSKGPSAVAAFQAILNLSNAGNPIILGIGNLLVPAAARAGARSGPRAAIQAGLRLALRGGSLVGIYFAVLLIWPSVFLSLAYGTQSSYLSLINPLRLLAVAQMIQYPAQMISGLLNSMGENRAAFIPQLAATLVTCLIGLPLALLGGVTGAAIGLGCSNTARCVTALQVLHRRTPRHSLELAGESI